MVAPGEMPPEETGAADPMGRAQNPQFSNLANRDLLRNIRKLLSAQQNRLSLYELQGLHHALGLSLVLFKVGGLQM